MTIRGESGCGWGGWRLIPGRVIKSNKFPPAMSHDSQPNQGQTNEVDGEIIFTRKGFNIKMRGFVEKRREKKKKLN